MSSDSPVILITGCSGGFGRPLALYALSLGLRVIATARRVSTLDELRDKGAKVLTLDVTASRDVLKEFAKEAIAAYGQVDILINNAGQFLTGAIEENTHEQIYDQFNTDFFGIVNLTCAFLPHMRQRRTGTIVNISSQGSLLAISGAGVYCASKAALETVTEAWSKELAPFNIRAVAIVRGAFRTSVAGPNAIKPREEINGYDEAHEFLRIFQERVGQELGDAEKAAKKLIDLITSDTSKPLPPRLALGEDVMHFGPQILQGRLNDFEGWKDFAMGANADGPVFAGGNGKF
ncbi:hypothetical protein VKT23_018890 [Stygiomarasmius scandens]|uniref:Uncharacterized protein n=1 Tax=Marasmiellus scandens TaxID=2682957 RepID=A0ABR1IJZ6_9AGAR